MTDQQELEKLSKDWLSIESNYDLFGLEHQNIPFWERVRYPLWTQLLREMGHFGGRSGSHNLSVGDYFSGGKLWLRNFICKNPFFAGSSDVLVLGHERRKQFEDGFWWDIYCDPIYDKINLDYLHLEKPSKNTHRTPAKTDCLRYIDLIEYSGTLQRKLGIANMSISENNRQQLQAVETELKERFGVAPAAQDRVEYELAVRKSKKQLYERLLDRVSPELVVVLVSYEAQTFVEACRGRGIPVVELQHGIVHPYHQGYHFPGDRTKEAFPDYFFSFGDFWNEQAEFPIPEDHVISVGYPYLEERRQKYAATDPHEQIIFLSQLSIGEPLSKMAVAASEHLPQDIVYKIHPKAYNTWEDLYPWLRDADVRVVHSDDPPLYQLLAESTVQVGVGSTSLYEGLQFDLSTYIVELPSMEYTRALVKEGYATTVANAEELILAIQDDAQGPVRANHLFADNPIDNLKRELDRLLV